MCRRKIKKSICTKTKSFNLLCGSPLCEAGEEKKAKSQYVYRPVPSAWCFVEVEKTLKDNAAI